MVKRIVINIGLDQGFSELTNEEIGYVAEYIVDNIREQRDVGIEEMEGITDVTYVIVEA
jgi:hypothetical protein